jgi:hypothetical protein
MNRKSCWSIPSLVISILIFSTVAFLTSCSSSSSKPTPVVSIAATAGTGQSAQVGAAFTNVLTATVTTNGSPTSGVSVTFTAPASGASGTFATTTPGATDTETTNASGVATSQVFTANTTAGAYTVTATATGATGNATFSLSNTPGTAAALAATSGGGQSAAISTAFTNPLVATVTDSDGNPVQGQTVTFTAPGTGVSGLFADAGTPAATDTETTDANGNATSTVFTANATVGGPYNITATSGALTPVNFALTNTAAVVVSPLPDGNYVYSAAGSDVADTSVYYISGAITIAGGVITGGEQDFIDFDIAATDNINPTGSSIATTADGNLQLILTTCNATDCTTTDTNIGVAGVETFNGSVLPNNANKAFIAEFDSSATSSGEIALQDPTAAAATPSLGYAFEVGGVDVNYDALAIGGILNVDGAGTISGTGSIFDANDDASSTTFQGETFTASTVSAPDAFGRVVFTLNATDTTDFPQIIMAGYIVDSSHINLVEDNDALVATTGGIAYSQGAATGTFNTASASGNSYVVGMFGVDSAGFLQTVGLITPGATTVTGFIDFNDLTGSEPVSPDPVTAPAYTVDATGRVTIANVTDGAAVAFNLQVYLDGNGHALALTLDDSDILGGSGYQQVGGGSFAATSFTGGYALGTTGFDGGESGEVDAVGPVTATGSGATFSGTVDLNWLLNTGAVPDLAVSGTYTSNADGIFTGTLTGLDVITCQTTCTADVFNYYLFDAAGDNIAIETDTNQLTLGLFKQQ